MEADTSIPAQAVPSSKIVVIKKGKTSDRSKIRITPSDKQEKDYQDFIRHFPNLMRYYVYDRHHERLRRQAEKEAAERQSEASGENGKDKGKSKEKKDKKAKKDKKLLATGPKRIDLTDARIMGMLVAYKDRHGTIRIGWSKCHTSLDVYNKRLAAIIAIERAQYHPLTQRDLAVPLPYVRAVAAPGEAVEAWQKTKPSRPICPDCIRQALPHFLNRLTRYYKKKVELPAGD